MRYKVICISLPQFLQLDLVTCYLKFCPNNEINFRVLQDVSYIPTTEICSQLISHVNITIDVSVMALGSAK